MPESVARQAEADAARLALEKRARGEALARGEISAIARIEKRREAERLQAAYSRCELKDLVAILGTDRKQIMRYVGYGLPRAADGTFDLAVAVPWLRNHDEQRHKAEQAAGVDAQEILRRERAQMMALRRQERQNEVAPVEHFRGQLWDLFRGFRSRLESFPRAVAQDLASLAPRQHQLAHEDRLRELLSSFAAGVAAEAGREPQRPHTRKRKRKRTRQ